MKKRQFCLLLITTTLFLVFLLPCHALFAEETGLTGFGLDFFQPTFGKSDYFSVASPALTPKGVLHSKISQSVAHNHLFRVTINGVPVDVVDRIVTTRFLFSFGITSFLSAGVDLPIHYYAKETNVNNTTPYTTGSFGDIRVMLQLRLLEEKRGWPGVALISSNNLASGNEEKFLGTDNPFPGVGLIVGKDFKYFRLTTNGEVFFPTQQTVARISFDDYLKCGLGLSVPLSFLYKNLSLVAETYGRMELHNPSNRTSPITYLAGLKQEFKNGWELKAGAGGAFNNAIGNPRILGTLSLAYAFNHLIAR